MVAKRYTVIMSVSCISLALPATGTLGVDQPDATNRVLSIRALDQRYVSYEPIVLEVQLAYNGGGTGRTARGSLLGSALVAELWNGGDTPVARALLSGAPFSRLDDSNSVFMATTWGCIGHEIPGKTESSFVFFGEPGRYRVRVRTTLDMLVSNFVSIEIVSPKDQQAAELFASGGLNTLSAVHLRAGTKQMWAIADQVCRDYPNSRYARILEAANLMAHAPGWRVLGMAPAKLESLADGFAHGHPYRILLLASAQNACVRTGDESGAQRFQRAVLTETSDPGFHQRLLKTPE